MISYKFGFLIYSISATIALILLQKGKFRIFVGILTTIQTIFSYFFFAYPNFPYFHPILYFYFQTIWFFSLLMQTKKPKLRSTLYRLLISWTSAWWTSTTWLGLIFLPMKLIYNTNLYIIISSIISILGVSQSLMNFDFGENVFIDLRDRIFYKELTRIKSNKIIESDKKKLTIFQMTDTHISSFTSIQRLKELCEKVVKLNPDLVALTGDFYTFETKNDDTALAEALEPLKSLKGRVVCCLGNHDYEGQLESILFSLKVNDVILLRDNEITLNTRIGEVQILGANYYFSDTKEKIENLYKTFPRKSNNIPHITLLHNPIHFQFIKDGDTDLVLSGHLHGGQIGLLSLGINFTFLRFLNIIKRKNYFLDNGLWGLHTNRVYSHRGTGHYGFPIRLGVPSEESLLNIYF